MLLMSLSASSEQVKIGSQLKGLSSIFSQRTYPLMEIVNHIARIWSVVGHLV